MIEYLDRFIEFKRKKKFLISLSIELIMIVTCLFFFFQMIFALIGEETIFPVFFNKFLFIPCFAFAFSSINYRIAILKYLKKNYYKDVILERFYGRVIDISNSEITIYCRRNILILTKEEIDKHLKNFNMSLIEKNDLLYIIFEKNNEKINIKRISSSAK